MKIIGIRQASLAIAATAVLVGGAYSVAGQTNGEPERFTAVAQDINRGTQTPVDIVINKWSTDAERDRLMSALMDKGSDALLSELQKAPTVGRINSPGHLGWDLHYARRVALPEGGERVVIATDRPVGFWEAANSTRSLEYPFTVIEMRLNRDGEGQGKMSVAAKITGDKESHLITIENWDTQPVTLTQVKRERRSE